MAEKEKKPHSGKTLKEKEENLGKNVPEEKIQHSNEAKKNIRSRIPRPKPQLEDHPGVVLPRPVTPGRPSEIKKKAQTSVPRPAPPPRERSTEAKRNVQPGISSRGLSASRKSNMTKPTTCAESTMKKPPTPRGSLPTKPTSTHSTMKKPMTPKGSNGTKPTTSAHSTKRKSTPRKSDVFELTTAEQAPEEKPHTSKGLKETKPIISEKSTPEQAPEKKPLTPTGPSGDVENFDSDTSFSIEKPLSVCIPTSLESSQYSQETVQTKSSENLKVVCPSRSTSLNQSQPSSENDCVDVIEHSAKESHGVRVVLSLEEVPSSSSNVNPNPDLIPGTEELQEEVSAEHIVTTLVESVNSLNKIYSIESISTEGVLSESSSISTQRESIHEQDGYQLITKKFKQSSVASFTQTVSSVSPSDATFASSATSSSPYETVTVPSFVSISQSFASTMPYLSPVPSSVDPVISLNKSESVKVMSPTNVTSFKASSVIPPIRIKPEEKESHRCEHRKKIPPKIKRAHAIRITPTTSDTRFTTPFNIRKIINLPVDDERASPTEIDIISHPDEKRPSLSDISDTTDESYVLARSNPSGESIDSVWSNKIYSVPDELQMSYSRMEVEIPVGPPSENQVGLSRSVVSKKEVDAGKKKTQPENEVQLSHPRIQEGISVGSLEENQFFDARSNEDSQSHSQFLIGDQFFDARSNEDSQSHSQFLIGDQTGSSKPVLDRIEEEDDKETPEEIQRKKELAARDAQRRKAAAEKARKRREAQAQAGGEGEASERRPKGGDKGTSSNKVTQRPIQTMSLQEARFRQDTPEGDNLASEERKINHAFNFLLKKFGDTSKIEPLSKNNPFNKTASTIREKLSGGLEDQILALNMLRGLALEISYEPKVPAYEGKMLTLLKEVFIQLDHFLSQGCPELIAEACVTVAWLSKELRLKLAEVETLQTIVTTLLHKATIDSEVEYMAKGTLRYIFQYLHEPLLFDHLVHQLEQATESKPKLYFAVAVLFLTVMEFWDPQELSPSLDLFEKGFIMMFNADVQCQAPLLLTFWQLNWDNHPRANAILNVLTPFERRKIENGRFIPAARCSQAELLPTIVRIRSKNINIEPEDVSEAKETKSMLKKLVSKIKLTDRSDKAAKTISEEKISESIPEKTSGKKSKKTKKDIKKSRRHKSSSGGSISQVSVSSPSISDESSDPARGKKHSKHRKQKLAKKKLQKLKKEKKKAKTRLIAIESSDSSEDQGRFFLNLKQVPTSLLNVLNISKKHSTSEVNPIEQQSSVTSGQDSAIELAELPMDIPGFTPYQEKMQELRSKETQLTQINQALVESTGELERLRRAAEESNNRLAKLNALWNYMGAETGQRFSLSNIG